MRDSEIKHCQSWREHYYATEAEIKRRGKVTVKPPQRIDMHETIVAERCVNCYPSRGQWKNIKVSWPAAMCCWPLFMQRDNAHAFPSVLTHPDCAAPAWCCSNGYSSQSSERALAYWWTICRNSAPVSKHPKSLPSNRYQCNVTHETCSASFQPAQACGGKCGWYISQ